MERVTQALANSALTAQDVSLQKSLSSEDSTALLSMLDSLTRRYPSQDLEPSIEEYAKDYERLAQTFSVAVVQAAVDRLRLRSDQKFFPRPEEVKAEIENERDRKIVPGLHETMARMAREREQYRKLLTDPAEIAWRKEHFGYDPFTEAEPAKESVEEPA